MLKYVAPLQQQLRHLSGQVPRHQEPTAVSTDQETLGQRMAEHSAALIGSWRFLGVQAFFLFAWVVVNGLRIFGFDPPPFILLNLLLSFQAAFTGPILLIAANVGAIRDHRQYDRMEDLERRTEDSEERIMRRLDELEANLTPPAPAPLDTTPMVIPKTRRRKTA